MHVILDAGHGGDDTGTIPGGVWEATYVYDVACRLRRILAERTRAEVLMTTKDSVLGWKVPNRDGLRNSRAQLLLTEPAYSLADPTVGVNLRWYLANSLIGRPGPGGTKVLPNEPIFVSLHATRCIPPAGAMVYVPGERYLRENVTEDGPGVRGVSRGKGAAGRLVQPKERVASEGVSTALANGIIAALREAELPSTAFRPCART